MAYVTVEVDVGDVLDDVPDKYLLEEVERRNLGRTTADHLEDIDRALNRKDWDEVEYLLRTYVLPRLNFPRTRSRIHAALPGVN